MAIAKLSHGSKPYWATRITGITVPSANTEPTDRSNSPEIMRSAAPSAISPSSGTMARITRMFPSVMKRSPLRPSPTASAIATTIEAISGRDSRSLVSAFHDSASGRILQRLMSHDEIRELLDGGLGLRHLGRLLAAREHAEAVSNGVDVVQVVRDEDRGDALGLQSLDPPQHLVGFLDRQVGSSARRESAPWS